MKVTEKTDHLVSWRFLEGRESCGDRIEMKNLLHSVSQELRRSYKNRMGNTDYFVLWFPIRRGEKLCRPI